MRTSLKTKVLIWFMGIITVVLFTFSYSLFYFLDKSINVKIQKTLEDATNTLYEDLLTKENIDKSFNEIEAKGMSVAIFKNANIISLSQNLKEISLQKYASQKKIFFTQETEYGTLDAYYIRKFDKPFKGTIVLVKNGLSDKSDSIQLIIFGLTPIFLLLIYFISVRLVNKILRPIEQITYSAKKMSVENLDFFLENDWDEYELNALAQTFNQMLQRLKSGIERMDRFNNDISHELRTPLTVMNTQIELALKKDRDNEYYKSSLLRISLETQKISQMIEDILVLTKYSKEDVNETFVYCDLNSILIQNIEKFTTLAEEKNITIDIEKFEKSYIQGNFSLISILFSNLIDNAIKYSLNDTDVNISLYMENERVYFIIEDHGIGIPKDSIDKITDRFFRVDESRTRAIKGFGLGLSLVKNIVELHNGRLDIESELDKGTKITIEL